MDSTSENATQAMTTQQYRDWVEGGAEERERFIKQQEKSMQQPGQEETKPPKPRSPKPRSPKPKSAKTKSPKTKSLENDSSETRSPDFLRLIPSNETAKLAFSELLDQKKAGKLSPHHFQYMVETGRGPLLKTINYQARSKSETPEVEPSEKAETSEVNIGYFRVSFDHEHVTKSATWVIGRGSAKVDKDKRNVDILLAAPGSKFTSGLLAAHAYLRMHPDSGVWMIHAALESCNRSEESASTVMATLDDHEIHPNGFRCLDRPQARLSILNMEFRVQFALTTSSECASYRDLRNQKLKEHDVAVPDTDISGIPLESDIRAPGLAVFSLGIGAGSFGSVYQAFDPVSGELRAVKVVEVKSWSAGQLLRPEIEVLELHPSVRGLVRQYGWCNSNGDQTVRATKYPLNIYIVQRKGEVFSSHLWQLDSQGAWLDALKLFQDLLHGLHTIHKSGWMHRDITIMNMLYFKGAPAAAALCDFGKLHFGRTDRDTRLAAWRWLPPEVVDGQANEYNQSIDVWMLAYALAWTWYRPLFNKVTYHSNDQITSNGLGILRAQLHTVQDCGLAKLLWYMLNEDPKERPPAAKLLTHHSFRQLKPAVPQEAESSKGKRRHADDGNIDLAAKVEEAMRPQ